MSSVLSAAQGVGSCVAAIRVNGALVVNLERHLRRGLGGFQALHESSGSVVVNPDVELEGLGESTTVGDGGHGIGRKQHH
jgi:hypothetical protein